MFICKSSQEKVTYGNKSWRIKTLNSKYLYSDKKIIFCGILPWSSGWLHTNPLFVINNFKFFFLYNLDFLPVYGLVWFGFMSYKPSKVINAKSIFIQCCIMVGKRYKVKQS